MLENTTLQLAPGQSRPLAFRLFAKDRFATSLCLKITFFTSATPEYPHSTLITHIFTMRELFSPHKVTFLHPGGIVSYAVLRAPSEKAIDGVHPKQGLPVLLHLHGAGLEADSHEVRHTLDSVPDLQAWALFPTGVTSWSADDWRKSSAAHSSGILLTLN